MYCLVVRSTSTWVITDGINAGVMKYVAEVFEEIRANQDKNSGVCIGVTPWNVVTDRKKLEKTGETVAYDISSSFKKEEAYLDNNHTHFLLVDQDPDNRRDAEIDFRADLERAISNTKIHGYGKKV